MHASAQQTHQQMIGVAETAPPWMIAIAIVMSHATSVATRATRSKFGADGVVLVLASDMVAVPVRGQARAGGESPVRADLAQPFGWTLRVSDPARIGAGGCSATSAQWGCGQCASAISWACSAAIALRQARTRARSALIPRIALPCQKRRIGFFMRFASPNALQA
jgi:hypothetical protein